MQRLAGKASIILIPLFIILLSFRLVVYDTDFYKEEFEKQGVYENVDKETADKALENLIAYMKGGEELSDFYNEKEKQHMHDVKRIVRNLIIAMYIVSGLLIISLMINKRKESSIVIYGGAITLSLVMTTATLALTSFDYVFLKFHELSFSNELWLLDPNTDKLKALMPDELFKDALIKITIVSTTASAALIAAGIAFRKKS